MARISKLEEFCVNVKARLSTMKSTTRLSRFEMIIVLGCYHIEGTVQPALPKAQEAASFIFALRVLAK